MDLKLSQTGVVVCIQRVACYRFQLALDRLLVGKLPLQNQHVRPLLIHQTLFVFNCSLHIFDQFKKLFVLLFALLALLSAQLVCRWPRNVNKLLIS